MISDRDEARLPRRYHHRRAQGRNPGTQEDPGHPSQDRGGQAGRCQSDAVLQRALQAGIFVVSRTDAFRHARSGELICKICSA